MLQRLSLGLILVVVLAPFSGLACALHCAALHAMPGTSVSQGSSCCPQDMAGQRMQGHAAALHAGAAGGHCLAALLAEAATVAAVRSLRGHEWSAACVPDAASIHKILHRKTTRVSLTAPRDELPPRLQRSPLRI